MNLDPSAGYRFRIIYRLATALFALLLLTGNPHTLLAQQAMRIVAVVNDEMISGYDLDQRIRLLTGGGNMPSSSEQRSRLTAQVLRSMVDERLELQEAKRLNISVEPKEIDDALARIEKQNGVPPGQLAERLKSEGMNIDTLETQIKAALAWTKVVRRRGARFATVSDDEVDEAMARIKENANKPSQLISQIFLPVDSPQEETQVLANAQRLLDELRQGASFPALAQQFSQDASARAGGDMGWLQVGQLPEEVERVVAQMPVGAVSMPIRSADGYHIVAVRDRRAPQGSGSEDDVRVSLHQIVVPISANARPEEVESQRHLAQTLSETVNGCEDMDKAAKEMGSATSGDLGTLRVGEMAADLRKVVLALKVGQASQPLPTEGGLRVLMVCERQDPPSHLPSREDISRMLIEQKLEMQARRLLRDLRQTAFVDIRA
jgi:peptidyl-prolyl cis-trans isomerase SurA